MFSPDDRDRQMVHLGQTFLLFLKIMGVSHPFTPPPPRNVRPRLWYTFLVCMGMSILRDVVSQKWNGFRQLFEQNCIEWNFYIKKNQIVKKIIVNVEEDWVLKLNWRLSIYYRIPVVEMCLKISLDIIGMQGSIRARLGSLKLFWNKWMNEWFTLISSHFMSHFIKLEQRLNTYSPRN
jgi:hypothetical protein